MDKMNSIEKAKHIDSRYREYLRDSFNFDNDIIKSLFKEELNKTTLLKGPYLNVNMPYKKGHSLKQLNEDGTICDDFLNLNKVFVDRPLYEHQEKALKLIDKGKSVVITTGTSSGKTESFLYPIINSILKDIRHGNNEPGIRAIFLYPMNALVNDQMDRVRELLKNTPEITYGFYTGETPEHLNKEVKEEFIQEHGELIEHELIARDQMRETPPSLLFTNFSMLEYLLIRPNDFPMFKKEKLNNWKYVVLDEAHVYNGSLGIEISYLLRRLTGLKDEKPQFVLTSATLGSKGKSEQEIIDFASNLTSVHYDLEDIVFADYEYIEQYPINYTIDKSDYLNLNANLEDIDIIKEISSKYKGIEDETISGCLFELLKNDNNVHRLCSYLQNDSSLFVDVLEEMKFSDLELIALISLINKAKKENLSLYDIKYHSFIRSLSGAYITLGENPKLSLTKTNYIGEEKAFELGNCRFCNSTYLIGKIITTKDEVDYLIQNDEIDIYENYGENNFIKLDYFLLKDNDSDDIDDKKLEECCVCSKCGCIYEKNNLNAKKCTCGEQYAKTIYKVLQSDDDSKQTRNNIYQCPCCGHKSYNGIVKDLSLGKDESTALIGQFLYETLFGEKKKEHKFSLMPMKNKYEKQKVKQFLAFSDSRQQASYAAMFMDSSFTRLIQKRAIWEIIKQKGFKTLTFNELVGALEGLIKDEDLFDNGLNAQKNAWIAALVELLRVDGTYDGEGLGLYYFALDLGILDQFNDSDVNDAFGKYNIRTVKNLKQIIQIIFSVFRTVPAIRYDNSSLTMNERCDNLGYRAYDNYISKKLDSGDKNIRSLIPINSTNKNVRYLTKALEIGEEKARDLISDLFDLLLNFKESGKDNEVLIEKKGSKVPTYRMDCSKYVLYNYKNKPFYRCKKCGKLTPYNVNGVCPEDGCDGALEIADPDEVLKHNFYRNEYKNKLLEKIVIKEHTAQIKKKTAKQYQKDFKDGKINILSCSTTFEMGVDIGSLENVFMRNVPPSPANYVQRAGRAGRGKDADAFVLTYCGLSSHDFTYFQDPVKMIKGIINPPKFSVENRKIIIRHLMAICLGFFFRKYPEYFKNIEGMVFGDGYQKFIDYVQSSPEDLRIYIDEKVLPGINYNYYHNFNWFREMNCQDEKLLNFIDSINKMNDDLNKALERAKLESKGKEIDYYNMEIGKLHKLKTIEQLSKYCIIPKYGFPVDVVELQVYDNGALDVEKDITRDLRVAISEFAPDSELIVDKKKVTAKYITIPKAGGFTKHFYKKCDKCGTMNLTYDPEEKGECMSCGNHIEYDKGNFFLIPKFGFKTGEGVNSKRSKPKKSYSGDVMYLGGGIKDSNEVDIKGTVKIVSSSNDELLVMNKSHFYMCEECGYSEIIKGDNWAPEKIVEHQNANNFKCKNNVLKNVMLGHIFQTDVIRVSIPILETDLYDAQGKALSFLYALLEGMSSYLEIDRNDIDGLIQKSNDLEHFDLIIYDTVAGGAGHVKRLLKPKAFEGALQFALNKVSQDCCSEDTSCYHCLRNYYNQIYHSRLKRKYAIEIINKIKGMIV